MGRFLQGEVAKFLDASLENEVNEEAFQLLSAFFESIHTQKVECFGDSYSANEAARRLSRQIASRNLSRDSFVEMINKTHESRGVAVIQQEAIGGVFNACKGTDSKSRWVFQLKHKPIPFFLPKDMSRARFSSATAMGRVLF